MGCDEIIAHRVAGKPLAWVEIKATSKKPKAAIDRVSLLRIGGQVHASIRIDDTDSLASIDLRVVRGLSVFIDGDDWRRVLRIAEKSREITDKALHLSAPTCYGLWTNDMGLMAWER